MVAELCQKLYSISVISVEQRMKELSWENIEDAGNKLAAKIVASGFGADYIIGITSDGLIPLYFLSQELRIKNILTISAKSYENKEQKELDIWYLPEASLAGKNILLIDEIVDTGETFKQIKRAMEGKYEAHEARTAALVVRTDHCKHLPDFYVVEANDWIVFPWEKGEAN